MNLKYFPGMHFRNFFLTILIASVFYGCKKDVEQPKDLISDKKTEKVVPAQTFVISESLRPSADSIARNWEAYLKVAEFLKINGAKSNEETRYNAKDLVKLTESLKDSIPLENLNNPAMKIRINVLHNEALRLQDMADIKVITDEGNPGRAPKDLRRIFSYKLQIEQPGRSGQNKRTAQGLYRFGRYRYHTQSAKNRLFERNYRITRFCHDVPSIKKSGKRSLPDSSH
ncbi:MAG: hypothetical protein U5K51_10335 [Flavobacteriaceae bacterium]|nr:hypothetical protein [Flavobacteriaceae bacterium]